MFANLSYREYHQDDLPGLFHLWEEQTEWGELTPEIWNQWFVDTPYGPCVVVVASDEDEEIVGQIIFTPSRVIVEGKEIKSARAAAPILSNRLRSAFTIRDFNHPALRLFLTGIDAIGERGTELVYSLPDRAWLPVFRWVAKFASDQNVGANAHKMIHTSEFPCWVWQPSGLQDLSAADVGWRADVVSNFGPEYGELWRTARDAFAIQCGVVRSPKWLQYKYGGHLSVEVRDGDGVFRGFAAFRKHDGLLADVLASRPADLTTVVASVLHHLATSDDEAVTRIEQVKAMDTAILGSTLRQLQFTPVDYKFGFFCGTLNEQLAQAIVPSRWHVTPGD